MELKCMHPDKGGDPEECSNCTFMELKSHNVIKLRTHIVF